MPNTQIPVFLLCSEADDLGDEVVHFITLMHRVKIGVEVLTLEGDRDPMPDLLAAHRTGIFVLLRTSALDRDLSGTIQASFILHATRAHVLRVVSPDRSPIRLAGIVRRDLACLRATISMIAESDTEARALAPSTGSALARIELRPSRRRLLVTDRRVIDAALALRRREGPPTCAAGEIRPASPVAERRTAPPGVIVRGGPVRPAEAPARRPRRRSAYSLLSLGALAIVAMAMHGAPSMRACAIGGSPERAGIAAVSPEEATGERVAAEIVAAEGSRASRPTTFLASVQPTLAPDAIGLDAREAPAMAEALEPSAAAGGSCRTTRARLRAAQDRGRWRTVLRLLQNRTCWPTADERTLLRTRVLMHLHRYESCALEGRSSRDPRVRQMSARCEALASNASPRRT